jgi:hypothetical protein
MKKRKLTETDRLRRAQMLENAERTRRLAEKALADLERVRGRPIERPESNAEGLRQLAEEAQADLDRREREAS